jgi:hypothetical protein
MHEKLHYGGVLVEGWRLKRDGLGRASGAKTGSTRQVATNVLGQRLKVETRSHSRNPLHNPAHYQHAGISESGAWVSIILKPLSLLWS